MTKLQEMVRFEAITGAPWPEDVEWASTWNSHTSGVQELWWRIGPTREDDVALVLDDRGGSLFFYGWLALDLDDVGPIPVAEAVETLVKILRSLKARKKRRRK